MYLAIYENYFTNEWLKRKLDKLDKKINLKDQDLFDEYDGDIIEGDIFVIHVQKGKYFYGKVKKTN